MLNGILSVLQTCLDKIYIQTGKPVPALNMKNQTMENQTMDTSVLSMISVKTTSDLIANCSAYNEFGTVGVSHTIEACEFQFSDYMIFSTLYVYFVYEYGYHI